jgi:class 3 adenylate cyclase
MRDEFEVQKQGWLQAGMPVSSLFTRVGVASGSVREAIMGHPQFQSLTVVGDPVILASNLCSGAPRDRNVVLASADTVAGLESQLSTRVLAQSYLKKIKGQQTTAYEVVGCTARAAAQV